VKYIDLFVYVLVLGVLIVVLTGNNRGTDAPPAPPTTVNDGPLLPPPSAFDEQILVQIEGPKDGLGTAFAINKKGQWVTARHVVDGCASVGLLVGPGQYIPASKVVVDPGRDLAIVTTGRSPEAVRLDLSTPLRVGTQGFAVGYPQGRPGEVATKLLARSRLISRGRRSGAEPVLAWAEVGRTRGLMGSLGGISGGPVFDTTGTVRGVIVAESPRRGRIYTTAPNSLDTFLIENAIQPIDGDAASFSLSTYGPASDKARRKLQVVKVVCKVGQNR
jgi:S1-C subfamily serine protease